jgi:hypothetical protein
LLAELKGDLYAAIAWNESRFNQFSRDATSALRDPYSTTKEYPLQGGKDPWDFGLMQINHPDSYNDPNLSYYCDDLIWNWVANVRQGKAIFDNRFNRALSYNTRPYFSNKFNPIPDPLTHDKTSSEPDKDQAFFQAYCYYNCKDANVRYWNWVPSRPSEGKPGYWIKETKYYLEPRSHANEVWGFYIAKPWNK